MKSPRGLYTLLALGTVYLLGCGILSGSARAADPVPEYVVVEKRDLDYIISGYCMQSLLLAAFMGVDDAPTGYDAQNTYYIECMGAVREAVPYATLLYS